MENSPQIKRMRRIYADIRADESNPPELLASRMSEKAV
jgi:hypothetical protein